MGAFRDAAAAAGPPRPSGDGSTLFYGRDARAAASRVFAVAPLVGDDVFVVLSAPAPGLFSWARLNPFVEL